MAKIDASSAFWLICCILLAISSSSGKKITNVRRRNSLTYGQKLEVSETIISPGGYFELGFFAHKNQTNRYLGIWFKKSATQAIVWVANRSNPLLSHSPTLTFQQDGNLVIIEGNATSFVVMANMSLLYDNEARLVLQDTGNLVLQDKNSKIVWQSFDFPTDTILPTMKYGYDKKIGKTWSLRAWKNDADPRPGRYSAAIDPNSSGWAIIWDRNQTHGLYWVGYTSNDDPVHNSYITFHTYANENQPNNSFYNVFTLNGTDIFVRYVLNTVGFLQVYFWSKGDRDWTSIMKLPKRNCEFYGFCGNYAICHQNKETCACFQGFEPRDPQNWHKKNYGGGCKRTTELVGTKTEKLDYIKVSNVTLPSNPTFIPEINKIEDCKSVCSANISCNGCSYTDQRCWVFGGDVYNVRCLNGSVQIGMDIYIKIHSTSDANKANMSMLILCLLSLLVVFY
ncbi:S-locus lectin protein kinase family protein [Euphorbia peplus]|nr:S-locus lectin protein kinase family protein [Euphorbia peplus]